MQPRCLSTHFILTGVVALSLTLLTMGIDANAQIAFASNRDGNFEIYVMDTDGRNPRRLTNNPAIDWDPSWSPDGEHIAFASERDGNFNIYVMDTNGKNPQNLTGKFLGQDVSPAWFRPPLAIAPAGKTLTMWGWLKQVVR